MNLKSDFVVALCNPQSSEIKDRVNVDISDVNQDEVSKVEVSLSSNQAERKNVCGVDIISGVSTLDLEYIHTTQEQRESSLFGIFR